MFFINCSEHHPISVNPQTPSLGSSLFQGQHVRTGDGVAVDEGEKLLEDGEEGPVGEHADALLHLHRAAGDGPPVHHAHQAQAHALPLRQRLPRVRLVELDGGAVHLGERQGQLMEMN